MQFFDILTTTFVCSEPMKMSVCETYSTSGRQCDHAGDVIRMTECAAYISHPAERKQLQQQDPDYTDIQ